MEFNSLVELKLPTKLDEIMAGMEVILILKDAMVHFAMLANNPTLVPLFLDAYYFFL